MMMMMMKGGTCRWWLHVARINWWTHCQWWWLMMDCWWLMVSWFIMVIDGTKNANLSFSGKIMELHDGSFQQFPCRWLAEVPCLMCWVCRRGTLGSMWVEGMGTSWTDKNGSTLILTWANSKEVHYRNDRGRSEAKRMSTWFSSLNDPYQLISIYVQVIDQ